MAWGFSGVGVAGTMAGQDRKYREVRREGGKSGQLGGNSLPFVGKVEGHGQT